MRECPKRRGGGDRALGCAWQEGQAANLDQPGKLPCQVLDHATGYLAAFGAMVALQRRAREGGSWLVRVSLAQTGRRLQAMGRVEGGMQQADLTAREAASWMQTIQSSFGIVRAVGPVEQMSETMPRLDLPPAQLDAHPARWLVR